jgi:hypothetical protein
MFMSAFRIVAVTVAEPLEGVTATLIAFAETTVLDDVGRDPIVVVPADAVAAPTTADVATITRASAANLPWPNVRLMSTSLLWSP